jgi:hypothetical protein
LNIDFHFELFIEVVNHNMSVRNVPDGLVLNWWTPRIGAKRPGRCLMTKPKRYKRYSAEFKREAILRASEESITDAAVCAELGISTRQFRR